MPDEPSPSSASQGRAYQVARTLAGLARRLSRAVAILGLTSGLAGLVLWLLIWWPPELQFWTVLWAVVTAIPLLGPAAILGLFYQGLSDVLALPERLSKRGSRTVEQSKEAVRAVTVDTSGFGGRVWAVLRQIWALRTVLLENRALLLQYGAILRFLTPGFLLIVVLAAAVSLLLLPLAAVAGLVALLW